MKNIFRGDITGGARNKGASPDTAETCIIICKSGFHSGQNICNSKSPGVVEMEPPFYLRIFLKHLFTHIKHLAWISDSGCIRQRDFRNSRSQICLYNLFNVTDWNLLVPGRTKCHRNRAGYSNVAVLCFFHTRFKSGYAFRGSTVQISQIMRSAGGNIQFDFPASAAGCTPYSSQIGNQCPVLHVRGLCNTCKYIICIGHLGNSLWVYKAPDFNYTETGRRHVID